MINIFDTISIPVLQKLYVISNLRVNVSLNHELSIELQCWINMTHIEFQYGTYHYSRQSIFSIELQLSRCNKNWNVDFNKSNRSRCSRT